MKRIISLMLCCVLICLTLTEALTVTNAEDYASTNYYTAAEEFYVYNGDYLATSVEVPQNGYATLTAPVGYADYRWQILAGDIWVNIQGEDEMSINLSYAMVANLMFNGAATVRCVSGSMTSHPVTVTVAPAPIFTEQASVYSAPAYSAQPPVDAPVVDGNLPAMAAAPLATEDPAPDTTTHTVVINYMFQDGTVAASPYTATVAHGSMLEHDVTSPTVLGYSPDRLEVSINYPITQDVTETVTYSPALVEFKVSHHLQNVENDGYTLDKTDIKTGYTESAVGDGLAETYTGFYSLLYDSTTKIAADGSTFIELYYDRYYYLLSFDLDGGYGVEPIYAKYGTPINTEMKPTKAGYTFVGWEGNSIPTTMPPANMKLEALWTPNPTATVTVVFWGENADDEGYSYDHTGTVEVSTAESFTFTEETRFLICGEEEHTHDEACNYACGNNEHTHNETCYNLTCTQTVHSHSDVCCENGGTGIMHWFHQDSCCKENLTEHTHTDYSGSCYSLTCTNTEHTHSDNCYGCGLTAHSHSSSCYQNGAGMDTNLWTLVSSDTVTVNPDGSTVVNVYYDRTEFTLTFKDNGRTVYTINEKWGADISEHWPIKGTNGTTYDDGQRWKPSESSIYTEVLVFLSIMPAESFTLTLNTTNKDDYIMHYMVESISINDSTIDYTYNETTKQFIEADFSPIRANYGLVTKDEDFFDLDGFTQWTSNPLFNINGQINRGGGDVYFYYTRNSYKLEYINNGAVLTDRTATVKYQEPLTNYSAVIPPYPSNFEPGAYQFEGWYDDQYFQQPTDWNSTMPASDKVVYAKWIPVTHTVDFYLTEEHIAIGDKLMETQDVPHGTYITVAPNEPTNNGLKFVAWFYKDELGNEHAFLPDQMPVTQNLVLYGKWYSDKVVEYKVSYVYIDDNNNKIIIADDTVGSGLMASNKIVEAKGGDELFEGYQTGYFPTTQSHTIDLKASIEENTYKFVYVKKSEVSYTVYYLDSNYNPLIEKKTVSTADSIVTENFVPIKGYMPDTYQKRLVLSADEDENVLIFLYTKDDNHAPLHVVHYIQNIAGEDYTLYQEYTDINALIGALYKEEPLEIAGFKYNETDSNASGTMTSDGLELKLYYDRIEYPYEFRFLEQGTEKELAVPVTGRARYQFQVSQNSKSINGYTLASMSPLVINIAIEDPADVAKNNVRTFYYQENSVSINYEVVGPKEGCGTVTPDTETVKQVTGEAIGSTAATTSDVYKFVGWYDNANCQGEPISTDHHYTPIKEKGTLWKDGTTYYAKFEYNLTSLTIKKDGEAYDDSDTFIFDVWKVNADGEEGTRLVAVTLKMGESITVNGLTVGENYIVSERTASGRYNGHNALKILIAPPDENGTSHNVVIFTNSVRTDKWLSSSDSKHNVFKKTN